MCFSESARRNPIEPPVVVDTEDCKLFSDTVDAMACRPSWTIRNVFKQQPSRPGLPRRLYGSAKINLNNYWSAFENLVKVEMSQPRERKEAHEEDEEMTNEINENLSNELLEDGKPTSHSAAMVTGMEVDATPSPKKSPLKKSVKASPAKKVFSLDVENLPPPMSPGKTSFPPACSRTPLATINGLAIQAARSRSPKPLPPLSPLSAIAENLARRLCKQL